MRYTLAAALAVASVTLTAAPAHAHHDTATSPVARYTKTAQHVTTATLAAETAMTVRDPRDRRDDAARTSRQYQRGGAPRWGDSGHPVWTRNPVWIRVFARCVRAHESATAGLYSARNPVSTAAGAYQMLQSTYQVLAHRARMPYRGSAANAPAWEQDVIFVRTVKAGGTYHWRGTHCGHGT